MNIDLNCDLGESFGAYRIGMDEEILPLISSANIACGFHASDPLTMDKTVKMAVEAGVGIGAHPGLPDLVGFGRRNMNISPAEAKAAIIYQVGALQGFVQAYKATMQHVKPHGALYNMAGKDAALAAAICQGIYQVNPELTLLALSGSEMLKEAEKLGLATMSEVFADRAYEADGSLVARSKPGAVITDEDEAIERTVMMVKEHKVKTIQGDWIEIHPDSICVHGDNPHALAFVQKIRNAMEQENIKIGK